MNWIMIFDRAQEYFFVAENIDAISAQTIRTSQPRELREWNLLRLPFDGFDRGAQHQHACFFVEIDEHRGLEPVVGELITVFCWCSAGERFQVQTVGGEA